MEFPSKNNTFPPKSTQMDSLKAMTHKSPLKIESNTNVSNRIVPKYDDDIIYDSRVVKKSLTALSRQSFFFSIMNLTYPYKCVYILSFKYVKLYHKNNYYENQEENL